MQSNKAFFKFRSTKTSVARSKRISGRSQLKELLGCDSLFSILGENETAMNNFLCTDFFASTLNTHGLVRGDYSLWDHLLE